MTGMDEIKNFKDPLMDRVNPKQESNHNSGPPPAPASQKGGGGSRGLVVAGVLLVAVLLGLGYFLYQAQQQILALNQDLLTSQERLAEVGSELSESQEKIGGLQDGLDQSTSQLSAQGRELGRYKQLYSNLRDEQGAHGKEIEALAVRKADQSQVDSLRDQASGIEANVGQLDSRLSQTSSNVADLREMSTRNRQDLEGVTGELELVRRTASGNSDEIAGVKRSLERDEYNFELHKSGGVMKVFDVALSLKKVDYKKKSYTIEILAGGERVRHKNQSINVPIQFYVDPAKKPYELVVSRVDKGAVVGQLRVPKG